MKKYKIRHSYVVTFGDDDEVMFEAEQRRYALDWIDRQKYIDAGRLMEYNEIIRKKRAVGRQPPSPSC